MSFSQYNSLNYARYLNRCDLNYKYFIQSVADTPKIDKITLELPTNMLPNIENTEDDYQNRLLLKCFLALYFISFKMPYINCNKFKDKDVVIGTKSSFHYAYSINYISDADKSAFLVELFNENDINNQAITFLTKLDKALAANENSFNVRAEIQTVRVSGYRDILNLLFTRSELQQLKLKLNIKLTNKNNKLISYNEIKNFLCMWNA